MMSARKNLLFALIIPVMCAVALGQATPREREAKSDTPRRHYSWKDPAHRWQRASDLIGKSVRSSAAEDVGKVEDMIVNIDTGRIIYMVVGCDGRQCAMPTCALELPDDASKFHVSCTKEDIKAQCYDKSRTPDFADRAWSQRIHEHFNASPYWQEPDSRSEHVEISSERRDADRDRADRTWYSMARRYQKVSDLLGKNVTNPQNESLGKIENLAVDPDAGRIIYSVLSFGGVLGIGDKLFAVPWSALKLTDDAKSFVLDVPKERFKSLSGFDKKEWPNMADERWAVSVHQEYRCTPYWQNDRTSHRGRAVAAEDPCPCGSIKKYIDCCMNMDEKEGKRTTKAENQ